MGEDERELLLSGRPSELADKEETRSPVTTREDLGWYGSLQRLAALLHLHLHPHLYLHISLLS